MIQRLYPTSRMNQAVVHNGIVYTAGQVAQATPGADVATQTATVLAQIDAILAEVGSDKSKVLSAYIYLVDMREFDAMNSVWDEWIARDAMPARTTIEARLTEPQFDVEIGVIAAI